MIARGLSFARESAAQALRYLSFEVRGMHQAAYLLAAFALGSQLLALVRDHLLAALFGAGHVLDIYYAAFLVPDFIFNTVASLFSLYALLPIITRLEQENEEYVSSFLRDTLAFFFLLMAFVGMIAYILAPVLAPIVAKGLTADAVSRTELVFLMRILLLQPILLGASNTIAALTQLRHRFVLYSISPLLYNLGIIFGAVVLYPHFGIAGLGFGVVSGAALHMLVQVPFFFAEKRGASISLGRFIASIRDVVFLSIPRTLSLASTIISKIAIVGMASFLSAGSIAVFNFAYNLQAVPLAIIGVSYSVAAFPTLAKLHAQGAREEFSRYIEAALRHIMFWSIPATVFVIVLRAQIVRTILGAGQFNWTATRLTAAAVALFILSLAAQSVTLLIARAYYASGNTRKPLYFAIADIVVSIGAAFLLMRLFQESILWREWIGTVLRVDDVGGATVLMLALGYALGSIAECAIGYMYFVRDFSLSGVRMARLTFETLSASIIGGTVSYFVLTLSGNSFNINTTLGVFAEGAVAGIIGLVVTGLMLYILKSHELNEAIGVVLRRFRGTAESVALEPSDVA